MGLIFPTHIAFIVANSYAVSGTVTFEGRQVFRAIVELKWVASGKIFVTRSKQDGSYQFLNIVPGAYQITTFPPSELPATSQTWDLTVDASDVSLDLGMTLPSQVVA